MMPRASWLLCSLALALACANPHVPAWELPPATAPDAPVIEAGRLTRTTLANGAHVIVLQDRRLPMVAFGVSVRRGAGFVPRERAGIAAFTAELMERGAGDRDALELAGVVDALGASMGVSADWDSMGVTVSGLSRDSQTLFDVLVDVTLHPRFDADEAARVRSEILAVLERAKDDPATLATWAFYDALYPRHRYGLPIPGTPEAVATFDGEAARAFHASVFTPANAVLWAVGDVDPEAWLARASEAFAGWQSETVPDSAPAPPAEVPPARSIVVVDRPDLGQAQIAIGHEGLARTDERRMSVQLLNTVLGAGGFSSRLISTVRVDEGLTYSIGSSFGERREPGPFSVRTFTRVPEVRRVIDLVLEELSRMRTDPPDSEELAKAKGLLTGSFGLALETSQAVATTLVALDVQGLPDDSLDTYRGRARAVTPEQVAEAALALLHPERTAIVVVGPAEAIVPQLEGLGPIRVVQP